MRGRRRRWARRPGAGRRAPSLDGAGGDGGDEGAVIAQDGEAAVAAVAGERHEHGRQGHGQRQAAGGLDVDGEQQNDRGDEEFAPGDAHERGDDADAHAGEQASSHTHRRSEGQWLERADVAEGQRQRDEHQ